MKKGFLLIVLLMATFFLDEQLTFFLSSLTAYGWVFSSYSLVIVLFYSALTISSGWFCLFLFVLGIFYDLYYFTIIGLAVVFFPFLFLLIRTCRPLLLRGFWERFLVLFMAMTALPFSFYLLGLFYGLTSYPITYFITFSLAPSSLLTCLYLLILIPKCDKLFLEI